MELWGRGKLWQHQHGLQKGGGGGCGRRNEALRVAERGWRYQKVARQQRCMPPGRAGAEAVVAFVVCVHVNVGSGLWCMCVCMLWSHLHSWKTLLSCCVRHAYYWPVVQRFRAYCLLLPSYITSVKLFFFLPGLFWLSLLSLESSYPVSSTGFRQIPVLFFSFKTLTGPSSVWKKIWVSTKPKPGRRKARLVIDCVKWCDALLVLPTSNCFSVIVLWQLLTQSSSKASCSRHDVCILLSAVLPIL